MAAGSALVAQIGNGKGLNAALGAAASQLAAGQVKEFADDVAKGMSDDPAGQQFIANIISNAVSGGLGYAAGGETGAGSASNMDRYNRQLHGKELERIKDIAGDFAKQENISEEDALMRLMAQALGQVDAAWDFHYGNDEQAQQFLAGNGGAIKAHALSDISCLR